MLDLDPADRGAQGPAAAGPDVPGRHRPRPRSSTTTRSRPSWPPSAPYDEWLHAGLMHLDDLPEREHVVLHPRRGQRRQQTFGYTEEELRILLAPMAQGRRRADRLDGHRHADRRAVAAAAAALRLLHPAVRPGDQPAAGRDPRGAGHQPRHDDRAGAEPARPPSPAHCRQVVLPFPVIDNDELAKIAAHQRGRRPARASPPHGSAGSTRSRGGGPALRNALDEICREVSEAIADGARIIVLSDRDSDADLAPIPSLLLTAAVHHHLIREQTRTQVGLVVEAGDVPRGAPRRAADRLRRRRRSTRTWRSSRSRTWSARRTGAGRSGRRRSATSSRRSARAC